ncbi:MAG: succinate dehydrogenase cytochrome b subunit [Sphingobacteriaceae bacterium]|nr:succinate dehydrogenase cytochrome b subunit [Sphingobacteriaceae bacterium]
MDKKSGFLSSSLGKKFIMGITGLFLISFLLVHCFVNSLIFLNDGGETFNLGCEFMGTNWIIRAMEIVLFAGIILHIVQALVLTLANKKARPIGYQVVGGNVSSTWYSRWMGLLGTLILMFLVIHLKHFWVVSRFTDHLVHTNAEAMETGKETMYNEMFEVFSNPLVVVVYCLAMISLAYHLLHGFQSAFQTLGMNHKKYTPLIKMTGVIFSIVIPAIFAAMPLVIYLGLIKQDL